jgi:hypothetical protein
MAHAATTPLPPQRSLLPPRNLLDQASGHLEKCVAATPVTPRHVYFEIKTSCFAASTAASASILSGAARSQIACPACRPVKGKPTCKLAKKE